MQYTFCVFFCLCFANNVRDDVYLNLRGHLNGKNVELKKNRESL